MSKLQTMVAQACIDLLSPNAKRALLARAYPHLQGCTFRPDKNGRY